MLEPRRVQLAKLLLDLGALSAALLAAWWLRFEGEALSERMAMRALVTWPWVVGLQGLGLALVGAERASWRHASRVEGLRVATVLGASAAALVLVRLAAPTLEERVTIAGLAYLPLGVIGIDAALALLLTVGLRAGARALADRRERPLPPAPLSPIVLLGAGSAGAELARELLARPVLGLLPVAFVDDDPAKRGLVIHGVPVEGSSDEVGAVAARHGARDALITIARASGPETRRLASQCAGAGLKARIVPPLGEVAAGRVRLTEVRELRVEDLLRRPPVLVDDTPVREAVRDQVVLVTGAGGSIGGELCQQLAALRPSRLVLVDHSERALFEVDRALREAREVRPVPVLLDIRDAAAVGRVLGAHRPTWVIHAAAYKHVHLVEENSTEAIRNNVGGTLTVALAAAAAGARTFVNVSTDKAVRPVSVLGKSKRLGERLVAGLGRCSTTRFNSVRFGNVLGSSGSVVPIFEAQVARGGPVTVTHPDVTRFFMTIPEACRLTLHAATLGRGNETFVLDMGEPVRIADLARDVIRLSGLRPDLDVRLEFTGLRPGEKLEEALTDEDDEVAPTSHPRILASRPRSGRDPQDPGVTRLLELADLGDGPAAVALLDELLRPTS